ncbi:MAG: thioesterase family protein, partial [Chloroflexi bacterium]|nr:thioesterase family protein [Chloroflexota bacterium]
IEESGYFLAATALEARYLRAARYDQRVTVRTWIVDVRSRAVTFACEVLDAQNGKLLFQASLKLVCLDSTGQPTRIPGGWQSWLEG